MSVCFCFLLLEIYENGIHGVTTRDGWPEMRVWSKERYFACPFYAWSCMKLLWLCEQELVSIEFAIAMHWCYTTVLHTDWVRWLEVLWRSFWKEENRDHCEPDIARRMLPFTTRKIQIFTIRPYYSGLLTLTLKWIQGRNREVPRVVEPRTRGVEACSDFIPYSGSYAYLSITDRLSSLSLSLSEFADTSLPSYPAIFGVWCFDGREQPRSTVAWRPSGSAPEISLSTWKDLHDFFDGVEWSSLHYGNRT